jgi:hypothetical protein
MIVFIGRGLLLVWYASAASMAISSATVESLAAHLRSRFWVIIFPVFPCTTAMPLSPLQGDTTSEQACNLRNWVRGPLGASAVAFGQLWAMSKARAGSCAIIFEESDIKRYPTTAYVARDILEIVKKHGQCRDWMEFGMDYPWSSIWNPLELESALIPWISNSIWKIHGIHG